MRPGLCNLRLELSGKSVPLSSYSYITFQVTSLKLWQGDTKFSLLECPLVVPVKSLNCLDLSLVSSVCVCVCRHMYALAARTQPDEVFRFVFTLQVRFKSEPQGPLKAGQ